MSANLSLHVLEAFGNQRIVYVVSSNPNSNTALVNSDYSKLGSVSYGESDSSPIVGEHNPLPLNATGLGAISKTGITKLGLRSYHDINNVSPSNGRFGISFSTTEATGTSQDPKLVVAYGAAPGIAVGLRAQQKPNPPELTDIEPEFSGVFVDPDIEDTASAYQIQVSTSPSTWTAPVWDSGKQETGVPIANGYRSRELEYTGDPLTPQVTYYWRMKFWDEGDSAGLWSTTTVSFVLAQPPLPLMDTVYGYDAVGNITSTTDIRDPLQPKATVYEYDDLDRLIEVATTTAAIEFEEGFEGDVVIQPDSANGKDTMRATGFTVWPGFADYESMNVGGNEYYSYLQFPLEDLPDAADIETATIQLFNLTSGTGYNEANFLRITSPWEEAQIEQYFSPDVVDYGMVPQPIADNDWWVVDVTQLVKDWKNGKHTNFGVGIDATGLSEKGFASSEASDASKRPKLVVVRTGRIVTAPQVTLATSTAVTETYAYDAIGNMTYNSKLGNYAYAGTGMPNPQAVTSVGGNAYTYDIRGNLQSAGGHNYTWDYRNRLIGYSGKAATSFTYDHDDSRVSKAKSGISTFYPNRYYERVSASTTRNVYLGDELIAMVDETGTSTYAHADHLGSTLFVTGRDSGVRHGYLYGTYGLPQYGPDLGRARYVGQEYDESTGLNYMGARYQNGSIGKFISQDPVFWEVGQSDEGKAALMNPQAQNSYSYAGNNPIVNKDPTGRFWWYGFYDMTGYEGREGVMMKLGEVFGGHARAMNAINRNEDTINSASSKYGIDSNLTKAIIAEEQSHLTPDEVAGRDYLFPNLFSGGVGTMQISADIAEQAGFTKTEVARNSSKNIEAGAMYLGNLSKNPNLKSIADVAARYNGTNDHARRYGERISAQLNNSNYNKNIVADQLKKFFSSFKKSNK